MKNYIIKKIIKKNKFIHNSLIFIRDKARIIYNQKRRSRFFWDIKNGDKTLSIDYPLNENSIFVDVGAHLGNFSRDIYIKYNCTIYAIEPLKDNFDIMSKNLSIYPKIICINSALSNFDGETYISNLGASSSLFNRNEGGVSSKISVKSFSTFVKEESLDIIDLVKMNIEGSEYELLDEIIESGCINKIKHLQIQFHNFVNDAQIKRNTIRNKLKLTHNNNFNYPFIWERWDIKSDS